MGSKNSAEFEAFVKWMRQANYPELVIEIYKHNYLQPTLKCILDDYFRIRKGELRSPHDAAGHKLFKSTTEMKITFLELIPTDQNADFTKTEAPTLRTFGKYLEKRFGKKTKVTHKVQELNYLKTFGNIFKSYDSMFTPMNVGLKKIIESQQPLTIVRLAADSIQGVELPTVWEIRALPIIGGKHHHMNNNVESFDVYAHELGHHLGLDHQWLDILNPPRNKLTSMELIKGAGGRVGVDDIMINCVAPTNKEMGHYLSPLSRYALEPVDGYIDQTRFGKKYGKIYSESDLFKVLEWNQQRVNAK
ncbi:MAG: hypothetical protein GOV00_00635 [Candidatus Altiarchaeota archaeon]|nr:hypothetical protein [Candidatus Altiarchaeota archaeon]